MDSHIDWLRFFTESITAIEGCLTDVLGASGCREGWPQAELFLAGRAHNLRVNEYSLGNRQTADLSCPAKHPTMLAELKIIGADHFPKMRAAVESDAARMCQQVAKGKECYMILVIPRTKARTALGDWLHSCTFSKSCDEREFSGFHLRIWRLECPATAVPAEAPT